MTSEQTTDSTDDTRTEDDDARPDTAADTDADTGPDGGGSSDLDAQIAEAHERNADGKPRLDRSDESQDFVDTSVMDFDPDDGLYSGTVVDGSTKIDGPHIGEDGTVDEQEQKEFLEQGKKEASEQGLLDDLPGGKEGDGADNEDTGATAEEAASDGDGSRDPGRHRPQPGSGEPDSGLDILDDER